MLNPCVRWVYGYSSKQFWGQLHSWYIAIALTFPKNKLYSCFSDFFQLFLEFCFFFLDVQGIPVTTIWICYISSSLLRGLQGLSLLWRVDHARFNFSVEIDIQRATVFSKRFIINWEQLFLAKEFLVLKQFPRVIFGFKHSVFLSFRRKWRGEKGEKKKKKA